MDYRILGRTGVKVAPLCLGAMNFGKRTEADEAMGILSRYVEMGGNFIDTANVYAGGRSEEIIGRWMKENGTRHQVVLSTKVFGKRSPHVNDKGNHRWHIVREVEQALRRLQTDFIDLYHVHRPDPDTPIDHTLRALEHLIRQGKVLYIASSTFPAWELCEAHFVAEKLNIPRFDVEQPPFNILDRSAETEVLPFCRRYNVAVINWGPLAHGLLCGKYTRGGRHFPEDAAFASKSEADYSSQQWTVMEGVDRLADECGIASSQFALAWCLHHPDLTCPIIGPRTVAQLEDNMAAVDVRLSPDVREKVDQLSPPGETCG